MFGDDGEDVSFWIDDVVENAKVASAEAILRLAETAKTLDSCLAFFARFMAKMSLDRPAAMPGTVHGAEPL
ncbi:MAG: hypothetical protein M3463_02015 [Verrucomicrobiota bacterium]|nr:hypothetical protein [Verrucomicrobiota bacterium]